MRVMSSALLSRNRHCGTIRSGHVILVLYFHGRWRKGSGEYVWRVVWSSWRQEWGEPCSRQLSEYDHYLCGRDSWWLQCWVLYRSLLFTGFDFLIILRLFDNLFIYCHFALFTSHHIYQVEYLMPSSSGTYVHCALSVFIITSISRRSQL